ncbi:MAG: transposase [Myxococcales bacterium]|jgi:putative transposase|nr:transposase [Myxococcales bacterium]
MDRIKTWEISDEFWAQAEPLIPKFKRIDGKAYQRKPGGGRKPKYSNRIYFAAIVYVLRNGIIWNALPSEKFEGLGSSAAHQKFQEWAEAGFFHALWEKGLTAYDELRGINWEWEATDGTNIEAPLARESTGPNPTDHEKKGTKRNMLTEGNGGSLAIIIGTENRHDSIFLDEFLDKRMDLP